MSCCRASTGVNPQDQHRLHQELLTIAQSFPQTRIACVVNRQGEIIAEILPDGFEREAMLSHLEHLKCAAAQLGASLGQGECPVLHIKGKRNVFSLYDVQGEGKEHIGTVAFFTQIDPPQIDFFDLSTVDRDVKAHLSKFSKYLT
mmetsp:Transcript_29650/g.76599  ORF Transcript_29650/g.76599 Transcript_29650/m.76599 type:complete len:145 (-) Transcript_29650:179-613(-)